jgi:hypothetical protein
MVCLRFHPLLVRESCEPPVWGDEIERVNEGFCYLCVSHDDVLSRGGPFEAMCEREMASDVRP